MTWKFGISKFFCYLCDMEKKIVFVTQKKGRNYVKYDDTAIGEELFQNGVIDEIGPKGKYIKCESWVELEEIESLGFDVKEE